MTDRRQLADRRQLDILLHGIESWNLWREEHPSTAIDLRSSNLRNKDLTGANLRGADLDGAYLSQSILVDADLRDCHMVGAAISGADLSYANLNGADLSAANLRGTNLTRSTLGRVHLKDTNLNFCTFTDVDFSQVQSLDHVRHRGPSGISTSTLERTAEGLGQATPEQQRAVESFFRSAGVSPAFMDIFKSLIGLPVEFYSAFISYNHGDKPFAQKLYSDLQDRGIRCWLDEKDGRIGQPIFDAVDQAIRDNDRVILCCSFTSLTSKWVDHELTMTFDKESRRGEPVLLPLDLDGALFDWTSGKAPLVRERIAARFQGWDQDPSIYAAGLERVVRALRSDEATRSDE